MPLNLYRRHRKDCEAGRPEDSTSGAFTERARGWKRCACQVFVSGTLGGKFSRRTTGKTSFDDAQKYVDVLEAAGNWNGEFVPPPAVVPLPAPQRITVADAIKVFLANREATVAAPTYRKYRTFTKSLQAFADGKGYVCLDQFRPADVDVYFTSRKLGPLSKAKMLDTLRGFFTFAVNRDWLTKSPVSTDLKPPTGANRAANKLPFTDEQLERIIAACDSIQDKRWQNGHGSGVASTSGKWGNRHGTGAWTGEDLKDFIWVSVYTGLRISDVVLFDMKRVQGNEVFLRAKKNGGDVFAYLPDWLRDRLKERAERCGSQPFMIGGSERLDTVIDTWRQRLNKVFDLAKLGEEPATPHRLRHTFARMLLQKGVPASAVADLMGDSEQVIRRHYARWVPERQAALTAILKDAFADKPKLVGISGGKR